MHRSHSETVYAYRRADLSKIRKMANGVRVAGKKATGTTPLRMPHWRPYPTFVRAEDGAELRPVYEDLHRRYPDVFGAELIETGVR